MHHHSHKHDRWYHGTVRDIFGHRFVLTTDEAPLLADIGPDAPSRIKLKIGAKVSIAGRQTPSEVKVRLIMNGGGRTIPLHKHGKSRSRKEERDLEAAAKVALEAGYVVEGDPIKRANHFELKTIRGGRRYELHIMPNGDIRKEKPLGD